MGKKPRSEIRIRYEFLGSYFRELKFFDADADPDPGIFLTLDPGSGMEKIRIRDKHPESTTLLLGVVPSKCLNKVYLSPSPLIQLWNPGLYRTYLQHSILLPRYPFSLLEFSARTSYAAHGDDLSYQVKNVYVPERSFVYVTVSC